MNSMIIGNNSNNNFNINNKFQKKIQSTDFPNKSNISNINNISINKFEKTKVSSKRNDFTKDIFSMEGGNASSSNDMYNKAIAMLNDRLEKGTITMDEFNKKCREIAKKRGNL